jgi:hypothetical protein
MHDPSEPHELAVVDGHLHTGKERQDKEAVLCLELKLTDTKTSNGWGAHLGPHPNSACCKVEGSLCVGGQLKDAVNKPKAAICRSCSKQEAGG